MKSVLFVCLGNICRSPAAEGVFAHKANEIGLQIRCDSAGTGEWHVGRSPDRRMREAAKRRGITICDQRARQLALSDFYEFDYIVAMDLSNQADILSIAPANRSCDIRLFLDFGSGEEREVPDPYYGGDAGFEHVLDLIEDAAVGLLDHIEKEDR
jgi:low molecular weight protein-tyrosine phosphatase